jgi:hypothetical protein
MGGPCSHNMKCGLNFFAARCSFTKTRPLESYRSLRYIWIIQELGRLHGKIKRQRSLMQLPPSDSSRDHDFKSYRKELYVAGSSMYENLETPRRSHADLKSLMWTANMPGLRRVLKDSSTDMHLHPLLAQAAVLSVLFDLSKLTIPSGDIESEACSDMAASQASRSNDGEGGSITCGVIVDHGISSFRARRGKAPYDDGSDDNIRELPERAVHFANLIRSENGDACSELEPAAVEVLSSHRSRSLQRVRFKVEALLTEMDALYKGMVSLKIMLAKTQRDLEHVMQQVWASCACRAGFRARRKKV